MTKEFLDNIHDKGILGQSLYKQDSFFYNNLVTV